MKKKLNKLSNSADYLMYTGNDVIPDFFSSKGQHLYMCKKWTPQFSKGFTCITKIPCANYAHLR